MNGEKKKIKNGAFPAFLTAAVLLALMAAALAGKSAERAGEGTWTLGNYNDASGNQGAFYTLRNNEDGTLIVIDGGWAENEAQVRQVIEDNGGHVDAWFITHTHNDHVGAFTRIFQDRQGILIDSVYDAGVDYEPYSRLIPDWDVSDIFPEYESVTENAGNVTHLHRGDTFSLDGLAVEVFNAYDEKSVSACAGDVVNNTSLMFRISGKEDSILFCGDNHSQSTAQMIEDDFQDHLSAEYVQTGHHGNNSLPVSFYEAVDPQVAIFDAPERIMTGDEYTARELETWFHERGVTTWDYRDAPHFAAFS